MADSFSVVAAAAVGASDTAVTVGGLTASTSIRGFIEAISVSCSGTAGDGSIRWLLQRYTAAGTAGSSVTPQPHDSAAPASLISAGQGAYSVEPTYTSTAKLLQFSTNQRASAIEIQFGRGRELVIPATSGNGIGLLAAYNTTSPPNASTTLEFHQ